jgi:hypothetical protein
MRCILNWIIALCLCSGISETSYGYYKLLDVDYLAIHLAKFGDNRDPLTPDVPMEDYVGRVSAKFQLRIMDIWYWRNDVHVEGTDAQFRTVGWNFELGLHVNKWVDTYYEHHSRHRLDSNYPGESAARFPVEDSYGVTLNFYQTTRVRQNLSN